MQNIIATASFDSHYNIWEGVIICTFNGEVIWKNKTDIGRLCREHAQEDARRIKKKQLQEISLI